LWTPELLAQRAEKYGLSVEDYKRRNLYGPKCPAIPVDGGSHRII
jgi:hypothetical protein